MTPRKLEQRALDPGVGDEVIIWDCLRCGWSGLRADTYAWWRICPKCKGDRCVKHLQRVK